MEYVLAIARPRGFHYKQPMLNYDLSADQNLLRQTVRDFAESEIKHKRFQLDRDEEFSIDLTEKMFDLGLFGITVDPKYGGQGMDYLSYILAVEELARIDGCQAATVAAENSLGIGPLYYFDQKRKNKGIYPRFVVENCGVLASQSPMLALMRKIPKPRPCCKTAMENQWCQNFYHQCCQPANIWCHCASGHWPKGRRQKELSCFIVEANAKGFTSKAMKIK